MDPFENLTIDTPEQVELEFEISGIGSRFLAMAIDTLIQGALYTAIIFLFMAIPALTRKGGMWWFAFVVIAMFCIYWGYFALFEVFWRGQTPGKRLIGIRVIKDSGRPANAIESIGRNLMRAIDSLPTMYGIGLLTMLINSKNKRLGDLVAGTIVVHERKRDSARPDWTALEGTATILPGIEQLTFADLELIDLFLQRRSELTPSVRDSTAHRVAEMMRKKLQTDSLPPMNDEEFLQEVVRSARSGAVLRKS
jgi:uncharacterized RDD family membrane protein YckC